MNENNSIEAKLLHIIFHNESNGYSVLKFLSDEYDDFIAVGYCNQMQVNEYYCLYGNFIEHSRYGMQFQFTGYELSLRKDYDSLVRFFSSSLFKGIGKATAKLIVDTLGLDAMRIILDDKQVLATVPGLALKKQEIIYDGVKTYFADEDPLSSFFARYGINGKMAIKIEQEYGDDAPEMIKENPYRLIYDIEGVGFQSADKIAMEIGFDLQHPYRIKARIVALVLDLCMKNGDTYTDYASLETTILKEFPSLELADYLTTLCDEHLLYVEDYRIYHHTQYLAEQGIAKFLFHFVNFNDVNEFQIPQDCIEENFLEIEQSLQIQYDDMQKEA
ncbi:MAG: ATP-dependent RecD-like DNA helicase, partial [Longicatena sp.]|nr:ATP-dependent RecD-like DNA helicase [Longicatena sp.]